MAGMKPRPIPPKVQDYLGKPGFDLMKVLQAAGAEANRTDRYLNWDEIRYRHVPEGITCEEWWVGIRFHRMQARRDTPIIASNGDPFTYAYTNLLVENLHRIDLSAGGTMGGGEGTGVSAEDRNRYLITSIMEESIMSSMLEGAAVTRREAKSLLRSNRKPANEHELMIINNYRTMQKILEWRDEPMTVERIMELHRIVTQGTLEPQRCGVLRRESDNVRIENSATGEVVHVPPPAATLPQQMQALCDFANGAGEQYTHPVLRAIILHFWMAYDHPFTDGNGRTARALFYWAMLHAGFWLFEYISISHEILSRPKSYYKAFRDAEEDENDLNYFISDQLHTVVRAIDQLHAYVAAKSREQNDLLGGLRHNPRFNSRQKALIASVMRHPGAATTVTAHCREHGTVRQTARTDLAGLAECGLFTVEKVGREFIYKAVPDFAHRIHELE